MTTSSALAGRIELAYDALGEVSAVLNAAPIPIIDGVLRLLRVVLDIREDVRHCKHEWRRTMLAVAQIQKIIFTYKEAMEISGEMMPQYMKDNLKTLVQHVKQVLETFNKYESHGHLGRVLLRHQSRREVKHCADMMWATVTLFNMRLNVEHANMIQGMQSQISTLTAQASLIRTHISSLSGNTAATSTSSLSVNMVGCNNTLMKMGWNASGNVLEETLEEIDETLLEEMVEDATSNGGDDSVLDWLGYLDFVEEI